MFLQNQQEYSDDKTGKLVIDEGEDHLNDEEDSDDGLGKLVIDMGDDHLNDEEDSDEGSDKLFIDEGEDSHSRKDHDRGECYQETEVDYMFYAVERNIFSTVF